MTDKNNILPLSNYFTNHYFSTKQSTGTTALITNFHFTDRLGRNYYFRAVEMGTWQLTSLNELDAVANDLLISFPERRVFAFRGEMGTGKTTFIKALCRVLGVHENVSSPTFALINEYEREDGEPVYHFDFYRMDKVQEAIDIGTPDYLSSGHYCFIEWAEKILHLLPEDTVRIHISTKNETRIIQTENG